MDSECSLGTVHLSKALLEGRLANAASVNAAMDDIDLDAIDAAMADEDNIELDDMKDALSEGGNEAKAPSEARQVGKETPAAANADKSALVQVDSAPVEQEDEEEKQPVATQQRRKVTFDDAGDMQNNYDPYQAGGFDTQMAFLSNCVFDFQAGKHRILSWNTIGVVGVRSEFQYTVIDVDFANKNFHRNLVLNDTFGVTMAAMNYNGVLLASQAEEKNEDQYEDDIADDEMNEDENYKRRKSSNIQYKPFNEWKDVKEWNYELKNSESVECLAVGSGWNAVLTNYNYIRIFSNNGIQKGLLCQAHPIVTMAGYENFLAIVY